MENLMVRLVVLVEINGELREIDHDINPFEVPSNILSSIEPYSVEAFELIISRPECPKRIKDMVEAREMNDMSFLAFDFTWDRN